MEAVPALLRDFRELRAAMQRGGLFQSSKLFYLWKFISTFSLLAGAVVVLLLCARESMLALVRFTSSSCLLNSCLVYLLLFMLCTAVLVSLCLTVLAQCRSAVHFCSGSFGSSLDG